MSVARRFGGILAVGLLLTIVSTATAKYSGGTGEPNNPYQIATAADLITLGETPADYDKHFILTADIDLDPNLPGCKVFDKAVIAPDEWPLPGTPFTGVFDGNGHRISHLTIRGQDYLGLFGQLGRWNARGGYVKNLGVVDVSITGSGDHIGGLVGLNWGTVTFCYSNGVVSGRSFVGGLVGDIEDGTVTECYSTGAVSGTDCVGGLVGSNPGGSIVTGHSSGSVSGTDFVGGLVGGNGAYEVGPGIVTRCSSTAVVSGNSSVGGLVGYNEDGTVTHSYSTGAVTGTSEVGGLVGSTNRRLIGRESFSNITHCYSTGTVSGKGSVGGLVGSEFEGGVAKCFWDIQTSGQAISAGGTGKTTAEMQTAKTFLDAGWDFVGETANGSEDIWKIAEGLGYPRLSWEKYSGGTGEPNDPYQIATAADLIALGETPADYDKHFILTADIDLDPNLPGRKVFDKAVIAWDTTYLGFQGTFFTGVLDGNGCAISHLTVTGQDYVGLFGVLGSGAEVKNLGVVDVHITGSGDYVGGLMGCNGGTVTHCYSTGKVSGSGKWTPVGGLVGWNSGTVTQCYSSAAVSGWGWGVGGLVGWNNGGTVTGCFSTGAVTGSAYYGCYYIGGLVGWNDGGDVTRCYSTGAVSGSEAVGGLVGWNAAESTVAQCYSTGAVDGNDCVGGLVGGNEWSVTACFWDTQTSGQVESDGGTGRTTAEMQNPKTFMAAGWDFVGQPDGPHDIWAEPEGGGYPILWWQQSPLPSLPGFSGGTGEPNDPYMISRPEELNSIGHNPRLMGCHFKLIADLDLTGFHFYPIGGFGYPSSVLPWRYPYGGTFDANGHTISHLTIKGESYLGLFGYLGSSAEVKDLGVVDVNITGSGGPTGGLVGWNRGTVTQCHSTGVVSGGWAVGGLVGTNYGTVIQCYNTSVVSGSGWGVGGLVGSNIDTVTNCYSTGAVRGEDYVGGLVGGNWWGTVTQCYSTGAVDGNDCVGGLVGQNTGTVTQCYSAGPMHSLVGHNYYGYVTGCFWDTQTSGQAPTPWISGTGKTTAEMQTASTFLDAGWDFVGETKNGTEDIWWIDEGKDYPHLWWELDEGTR